jgi:hypothetical protein
MGLEDMYADTESYYQSCADSRNRGTLLLVSMVDDMLTRQVVDRGGATWCADPKADPTDPAACSYCCSM